MASVDPAVRFSGGGCRIRQLILLTLTRKGFSVKRTFCCLMFAVVLTSAVRAEKNTILEPCLGKLTGQPEQFSFDNPVDEPFQAIKGAWKVVDGALVGKELAADKHAAVLNLAKKNRNSVIRFSFRTGGSTDGLHFSLNHSGGHLFRIVVSPQNVVLNLDKDKKDPKSKAKTLAQVEGKFESGRWYTMQVEMAGEKVAVQTDNGLRLEASHPSLDTDKPGYRFVMKGESLSIDDIFVWEMP
ncbi:MAG: hypothetical protein R3C49_10670 [Planctomycetaceae bacterium]